MKKKNNKKRCKMTKDKKWKGISKSRRQIKGEGKKVEEEEENCVILSIN